MKILAFLAASLVLALGLGGTPSEAASQTRHQSEITIEKNEVVSGSLYASGEKVVIEGIVEGDLVAAAPTVTVKGQVKGSVLVLSQDLTIAPEARIDGNLRSLSEATTVNGVIIGDLTSVAVDFNLSPEGQVGGAAYLLATDKLALDGKVSGEVKKQLLSDMAKPTPGQRAYTFFAAFLSLALLGLVVHSFQSISFSRELAEHTREKFLLGLGVGVGGMVLVLPLVIVLMATGIGTLLGIFLMLLLAWLILIALVDSSYVVGIFLLSASGADQRYPALALMVGSLVMTALLSFPVTASVAFILIAASLGVRLLQFRFQLPVKTGSL